MTKTDLDLMARDCREWQDKNFKTDKVRGALTICEEAGEIARAVNKEDAGIRPETRGNVGDEIGDVILGCLALADRYGLSVTECLHRRNERRKKLDFTIDPEGGGTA